MRETEIVTNTHLEVPPATAFEYLTTAANWPAWHPSSVEVRGDADAPGDVGASIEEDFLVAGRTGTVVWTVTECQPPRRWVIDGIIVGREIGGRIVYDLSPEGSGTRFTRTFTYPVPWRFAVLDRLVVRRRVRAESEEATRRLGSALSSSPA